MSAPVARGAPRLDVSALAEAGRDVPERFRLSLGLSAAGPDLAGGDVEVCCHEILRLLPGRRLVARVTVDGRDAVMKLFLGTGAVRYCRREAEGCARLAAAGVATPRFLGRLGSTGRSATPARGLLFEHVAVAAALGANDDEGACLAAAQLARLHAAGCRHHDLHLDNFLRDAAGRVWLVDGDGVRAARAPPGRRSSLHDLGVLCAQRPPLADAGLDPLYRAYAGERGWPADGVAALAAATRRHRRARLRGYLEKALRDCTEFRCERTWQRGVLAVRAAWGDELAAFCADPQPWCAGAEVVKGGRSATVLRGFLDGQPRIVKRYNVKGPWHWLRRALHPRPRFRRAWLNGQRLHLLGIDTARPLALVERRFGPLRGVAYLVMEDRGRIDLATEIDRHGLSDARLAEVVRLFRALGLAELTHSDTKATNFLLDERGLCVIDLDSMREGSSGVARDIARFFANFDTRPEIRARVEAAFAAAQLPHPVR